jgi:hypothetical protein
LARCPDNKLTVVRRRAESAGKSLVFVQRFEAAALDRYRRSVDASMKNS